MSNLTRVEKTGSIFYRITGLIRSGLMKWEDRPLWYDVYAAHPPRREPVWNHKEDKHDQSVRPLIYAEDAVRARFYQTFGSPGAISCTNERTMSLSQRFINQYLLEKTDYPNMDEDGLFRRTTQVLVNQGVPLQAVKSREFVDMRIAQWRTNKPDKERIEAEEAVKSDKMKEIEIDTKEDTT